MFDMRYHIASLVAVFLALAIGILLGTVIVDKGLLVNQQQSMVKRIESGFTDLRAENRTLSEEVSVERNFATQVMPLTIKERLAGKNVMILATTPVENEVMNSLVDNLKKAGATASSITLAEGYKPSAETVLQLKPYYSKLTQVKVENATALMIDKMIKELVTPGKKPVDRITVTTQTVSSTATATSSSKPFLAVLKDMGFIKTDMSFKEPVQQISSVIIFGGSDINRDPQQVDMPIIVQLKAMKMRIVGVEITDCKHSFVLDYQNANIPTVDNVNQQTGVISTIFALAGTDGNFGVKKTAQHLMPITEVQ